jgi:hypothetical protein
MNLLNSAKLAVLGTVGLSAIGFLGVAKPAEAASVRLGSDYFQTQGGTFFNFGPDIGNINFTSNPLGTFQGNDVGQADTIVERNGVIPSKAGQMRQK